MRKYDYSHISSHEREFQTRHVKEQKEYKMCHNMRLDLIRYHFLLPSVSKFGTEENIFGLAYSRRNIGSILLPLSNLAKKKRLKRKRTWKEKVYSKSKYQNSEAGGAGPSSCKRHEGILKWSGERSDIRRPGVDNPTIETLSPTKLY